MTGRWPSAPLTVWGGGLGGEAGRVVGWASGATATQAPITEGSRGASGNERLVGAGCVGAQSPTRRCG